MANPQTRTVLDASDIVIETANVTPAETAAIAAVLTAASGQAGSRNQAGRLPDPDAWRTSLRGTERGIFPGAAGWRNAHRLT